MFGASYAILENGGIVFVFGKGGLDGGIMFGSLALLSRYYISSFLSCVL